MTDLNRSVEWPFADGAEEIVVRVSRYEKDLRTPACFQAVVKHRNRHMKWGVGVFANPVAAVTAAIEHFNKVNGEPWPDGKEHGQAREPLIEEDIFG